MEMLRQEKKELCQKIFGAIASEDASNVKDYLLTDIIIPKIKEFLSALITNGGDMLIYGSKGRSRNGNPYSQDRVSYQNYYKRPSERYVEEKI